MFDLEWFLSNHIEWSRDTFGHGRRTKGISEHIRKELLEIEANPLEPDEWVDVIILALDGAWRTGTSPKEVCYLLREKQKINMERKWPPIGPEDVASEHIREK